jgi:2Fe-2S ferredoxin
MGRLGNTITIALPGVKIPHMPRVIFNESSGARREIDAPVGLSLMEAAVRNGVPGIVAKCGGACACATCHVYVDAAWALQLPPREDMEEGMLESAWQPRENSRLSCQIQLTAGLDGLEVTVPQRQGES